MENRNLIENLRELLKLDHSIVRLRDNKWVVTDRVRLWNEVGTQLFDQDLDNFAKMCTGVLAEPDPKFDLEPEERYAANVHGKVLKHSAELRKGLAETLALLGNYGDALPNCSKDKPKRIASDVVCELLHDADWKQWGSLDNLLPILAEAAPDAFLDAVNHALDKESLPFDKLFAQEGRGITGDIYVTGLLWALEALAWNGEYLGRVCLILAQLTVRDPGGNWSNRPINTLRTIFLPWFPQTNATTEIKVGCVRAIKNEFPDIAWEFLIDLLPNRHQSTSGTYKPKWNNPVPSDFKPTVSSIDYWKEVDAYADIAVEIASKNQTYLPKLILNFGNLPPKFLNAVLEHMKSDQLHKLDGKVKEAAWESLQELISRHQKYSDAAWALPTETVEKLKEIIKSLEPEAPKEKHKSLFSWNANRLFSDTTNWQEQEAMLIERRKNAVQEILNCEGLIGVINFARTVEVPRFVGFGLSDLERSFDQELLPTYLIGQDKPTQQLVEGYIEGCLRKPERDWKWVDSLNVEFWSNEEKCQFLLALFFEEKTWLKAEQWLGIYENAYWEKIDVRPFRSKDKLLHAARKLLEVSRPFEALDCLYSMLDNKSALDWQVAVKALFAALEHNERLDSMSVHSITEIIKYLQDASDRNIIDLIKIEWGYLEILKSHYNVEPKTLFTELANDPKFFCEILKKLYRSKKVKKRKQKNMSKEDEAIASNAWLLLHEWNRPPGLNEDNTFAIEKFLTWFDSVKNICEESGHLEVALSTIGKVLFYTPVDPSGLWIIQEIAEVLNKADSKIMREGFQTEVSNSRGGHIVDPSGEPERKLAQKWRTNANVLDAAGFPRFAASVRDIADYYENNAKWVVHEFGNDLAKDT